MNVAPFDRDAKPRVLTSLELLHEGLSGEIGRTREIRCLVPDIGDALFAPGDLNAR